MLSAASKSVVKARPTARVQARQAPRPMRLGRMGQQQRARRVQVKAVQEVFEIAADNRLGVLLFIIAPALGWVGFNSIAGLQRQVNNMAEKNEKNKR
mmetsp:Transcript_13940/g.26813  ORF Transcript_13940/g.26813 Transcript_13940/m.26813 type:complete len:97 (+) Transcript_13940:116-406(+)|eukprot:CAMPEP_0197469628 /NCGR_PEP_ID=MMETSP1309-20131121/84_1 /TAXON_ID=464262 /ORGANISM="Genus nov. species nov., Strain RCC998" /LENGTH=96 /DNA_ID=CAMNT_0043005823 /DNA_START=115 /DNA_END=405 /DNA_ORIENTATION=+